MKNISSIMFTLFLLSISNSYVYSQDDIKIQLYTSEFPPYNYSQEDGTITGVSSEIVQAVLKELNITAKPKSMPWARVYIKAQQNENNLLYSITRTKKREKLFKWIGVIAPADYTLWAMKSREDIVINTIEDIKQYKIGTTNNDVVEQYLKSKGFPNIQSSSGQNAYENNIKKLTRGKIDLWGVSTLPGHYFLKVMKQQNRVKKVFVLEDITSEGVYMAFGLKTSDKVVAKFKNALESIKKKGIYKRILNKYLQ